MELKNSRRQAIVRLMEEEEEIINFWDNHIEWINEANQKAALKTLPDYKHIHHHQMTRLIEKAQTIKLPLAANS